MRSKTWVDGNLRVLRFRCAKCVVAWGGGLSDYQQEDGDSLLGGLQDKQECEICGRKAIGPSSLWTICKVSVYQENPLRIAVRS